MYSESTSDSELVIEQKGGLVHVTLNRPEALNALTLEMIRMLAGGLDRWENDPAVKAVLITGAGVRSFCAGGDIKMAYREGMSYRRGETSSNVVALFFGEEYRMNRRLYHFRKPLIAYMDGITMGGGFGVAGPCSYRIATENTVFAMPETGIGFFPDVGSTFFLNQCPGQIGTYLAVTGSSIGPADMIHAGLATHFVPSGRGAELLQEMVKNPEKIENVLYRFSQKPDSESVLMTNQEVLNRCFAGEDVGRMLAALRADSGSWARQAASVIESRSPLSLKASLAHYRKGEGQSFDDVIARDFILVQHFLMGHDFYEGVRAAVIDKDRQPQWDPARLEDVPDSLVSGFFKETGIVLDDLAA